MRMRACLTAALTAFLPLVAGCPASGEEIVRSKVPNSIECVDHELAPHELVLEQPDGTKRRSICVNQETYDYNVLGGKYRVRLNN